tara:strand:+ start:120 stop:371 length:252 start_codon:yes stop_codon:yes gene_type:complete
MIWQDIVLASGSWLMGLFLLPTLLSSTRKPHIATAILTGSTLVIFTYVFITLEFYLTAIPTFGEGIIQFILAYQSYKIKLERL